MLVSIAPSSSWWKLTKMKQSEEIIWMRLPNQTKNDRDLEFGTHTPLDHIKNMFSLFQKNSEPAARWLKKTVESNGFSAYLLDCLVSIGFIFLSLLVLYLFYIYLYLFTFVYVCLFIFSFMFVCLFTFIFCLCLFVCVCLFV